MSSSVRVRCLASLLCLVVLSSNCVVRGPVAARPVTPSVETVRVSSPVKAHLVDGTTIVYANGLTIGDGRLVGYGIHYDLTLTVLGPIAEVPLDRVLALESFENTLNKGMTALATSGVTAAAVVGAAVLTVAIFGSCPTIYSESDGREELEAELFSYSIAPIFELQDLDRLRAQPGTDGSLRLDVRNEALETHYLNHLALIEVQHAPDEIVMPDTHGNPVALSALSSPEQIVDRKGRDLLTTLRDEDDLAFRTDRATMSEVNLQDLRDSIEIRFPAPQDRDHVALVFRLRNSLLNTVLFYDMMLGAAGARSLDWLGKDLGQIGPALELSGWYSSRMGMRVSIWKDGAYREVARVPDTGPIAWKDVAVVLPIPGAGDMRVRLDFVADNWRIDRLRVAAGVRSPAIRSIPITKVVATGGVSDPAALRSLESSDDQYLRTSPGQGFKIVFDAGESPAAVSRTFLLASQGYYTEWIRGSWIQSAGRRDAFVPTDEALLQTILRWRDVQPEFEARFDATRIPVR
ncbi:MAG TPA: hypothetical protein VMT00_13290 [Thermoanaerobaculia bacterium]|nr:hypothetical protein [Thermoanaerobaculia bacterium]